MTNTEQAERDKAARAMLAALELVQAIAPIYIRGNLLATVDEAIAQAKAAGIES